MSEVPPPEATPEPPPEGDPETFDKAYVSKLRDEAAKYRTDAKANAKAADELAAIKKSQQTEAEKAADELATARAEAAGAKVEAMRFRIASEHGIEAKRAALLLNGSDEETMTEQAKALVGMDTDRKKNGNHVPREGANPPAKTDDERAFVRDLFGTG